MKYLLLYILSSITLLAADTNLLRTKIVETIMNEVSINANMLIWSDNTTLQTNLKINNKLNVVNDCQSASILIIETNNLPKECKDKHIFALNYKLLVEVDNSFGALFWKKGRPNIIILKPRADKQSIEIKKGLEPYLEEKIW